MLLRSRRRDLLLWLLRLPQLRLFRSSIFLAVNDSGQIVSGATGRASVYRTGCYTDLTTTYSGANAINQCRPGRGFMSS